MHATLAPGPLELSPALLDAIDIELRFPPDPPTPVEFPDPTLALIFRHSHWSDQRQRVLDALNYLDLPHARRTRYAHCGTYCRVVQSDDDPNRYAVQSDTCHDRWCQPCATERARRIGTHIRTHIGGKTIRMLTLTLKHSHLPLIQQVDRLGHCLRTLRRSVLWTRRVTGGCCMLECKWSTATQAWHPHAHLLLEGRFIPHADLKKLWHKITGDSYIVHIRPCDTAAKAAAYVAKYVGKPWTGDVERSPHLLRELIVALENRRLCHTFGTWRGLRLSEPIDTGTWHYVCNLDDLLTRAKRRETEAVMILELLACKNTQAAVLAAPDLCVAARDPPCPDVQLTLETPMAWTQRNPP